MFLEYLWSGMITVKIKLKMLKVILGESKPMTNRIAEIREKFDMHERD